MAQQEMVRMAADGASTRAIAQQFGINKQTVARAVRTVLPQAFRRDAIMTPSEGVVSRDMPHNAGCSTMRPTHHAISLPKLRCLA